MRHPLNQAFLQSIFLRRLAIVVVFFGTLVFLLWFLPWAVNPVKPSREKIEADRRWVDTSPYWVDRQACRWLGLCGLAHVREDPAEGRGGDGVDGYEGIREESWWYAGWEQKEELRRRVVERGGGGGGVGSEGKNRNETLRQIPQYVLDHAPLVHLYSGEYFWPSDMEDHLRYMKPQSARGKSIKTTEPLGLENLSELDARAREVFLTSQVDVENRPGWLHSKRNIPVSFPQEGFEHPEGDCCSEQEQDESFSYPAESTTWFDVDARHPLNRVSDPRHKPPGDFSTDHRLASRGASTIQRSRVFHPDYPRRRRTTKIYDNQNSTAGYSTAPATLILVDKGSGVVDAFWFFFYAYNLGQTVLGTRYGNHVGDWEHTMIRFESGVPRAVYFSEHEGGQAYAWSAVEKYLMHINSNSSQEQEAHSDEKPRSVARPVIYSAVGSHAMYATPGDHPYVLPFKVLRDITDKGPLWDPAKNIRSYWYDYTAASSSSSITFSRDENDISDRGLIPTSANPSAPTSWFHYTGRWGDDYYTLADERQYRLFGQYHYVAGPQGPKAKNLGRTKVCQSEGRCRMIHSLDEGRRSSWH